MSLIFCRTGSHLLLAKQAPCTNIPVGIGKPMSSNENKAYHIIAEAGTSLKDEAGHKVIHIHFQAFQEGLRNVSKTTLEVPIVFNI